MQEANFNSIFVGIESPDTDILIATQKKQNTRRSLSASVHKIYSAGMLVTAGFIVGFDAEKKSVADEMIQCIESTSIPVCMVGLLAALPGTQLTRRLAREGRLHRGHDKLFEAAADHSISGLNFETLRPRRDIYIDYAAILQNIYDPTAYFARVRWLGRSIKVPRRRMRLSVRDLLSFGRLIWRMSIKEKNLLAPFWQTAIDCAIHNLPALKYVMMMMAVFLHLGPFSRYVRANAEGQVARIDRGEIGEFPTILSDGTLTAAEQI
jgi:radical SAM superfamily enzyme YgiQ (UPF0313 family)